MKRIYLAGPYTKGDVAVNVANAIRVADHLLMRGYYLFVPHLTHFWHLICSRPYDCWLRYDLVWLEQCDAMVRIMGDSNGADKEEEKMTELARPIFYLNGLNLKSLLELNEWLSKQTIHSHN
ncbi:MAG: DUF4406 domain-containing protein [Pseudomonadota bacterium]